MWGAPGEPKRDALRNPVTTVIPFCFNCLSELQNRLRGAWCYNAYRMTAEDAFAVIRTKLLNATPKCGPLLWRQLAAFCFLRNLRCPNEPIHRGPPQERNLPKSSLTGFLCLQYFLLPLFPLHGPWVDRW